MLCCWSGRRNHRPVADKLQQALAHPSLAALEALQKKLDADQLGESDMQDVQRILQRLVQAWHPHTPKPFLEGLPSRIAKHDQQGGAEQGKERWTAARLQDGRDHLSSVWQNWAASTACIELKQRSTPVTNADLRAIIANAVADHRRIRCVGHAHSWTPVFADTPDTQMVYTKALQLSTGDRIGIVRKANIKTGQPALVRVAAGVTTGELAQWMDGDAKADLGYTGLPADIILNTVRYGGAISMACHGVGRDVRDLPDSIVAMTVVNTKGTHVYSAEAGPGATQYWNEIRGSFGLMGVIQDITFQLDANLSKPYVDVQHRLDVSMRELFGAQDSSCCQRLKELVHSNWATELFWFPLNSVPLAALAQNAGKRAQLQEYMTSTWEPYDEAMWLSLFKDRVAPPAANGKAADVVRFVDEATPLQDLETRLGGLTNVISQDTKDLWLQVFDSVLGWKVLQLEHKAGYLRNGVKSLPAAIHYQMAVDNFPVNDFEMCFKVADDFSNIVRAWRAVVDIAAAEIRSGSNALNVAMECRFTRGSFVTMSPAYMGKQDDGAFYCWLEVLSGRQTKNWEGVVRKVFDAWTQITDPSPPKPHWAKWNTPEDPKQPDYIKEYAKRVYAAQIRMFQQAVHAADPEGVFRSEWLADLFQL